MSNSVFFSWQSDTPSKGGRSFIEQCLNRAVGAINSDIEIQDADRPDPLPIEVDKDTKGVPGSPSIVDTIFKKIERALCFVADLTFVAKRLNGGGVPNPNVMIEYGYALQSLGEERVICVMNEAYGAPSRENMPFDLVHKRFPITYSVPDDATSDDRKRELTKLAKVFERAIRDVIDHHLSAQLEITPPAFPAKTPAAGRARFMPPLSDTNQKTRIGRTERSFPSMSRPLVLDAGPAMYLRVFPNCPQYREWTLPELRTKESGARGLILLPFRNPTSRFYAEDGFGWYSLKGEGQDTVEANSLVIAFTTGEIWSVDTSWLQDWGGKIFLGPVVEFFSRKLENYSSYLQSLGIEPPFSWVAGFEGIEGLLLDYNAAPGYVRLPGYEPACLAKGFEVAGLYSPADAARDALRPFFEMLCHKCAIEPPRHIITSAAPL